MLVGSETSTSGAVGLEAKSLTTRRSPSALSLAHAVQESGAGGGQRPQLFAGHHVVGADDVGLNGEQGGAEDFHAVGGTAIAKHAPRGSLVGSDQDAAAVADKPAVAVGVVLCRFDGLEGVWACAWAHIQGRKVRMRDKGKCGEMPKWGQSKWEGRELLLKSNPRQAFVHLHLPQRIVHERQRSFHERVDGKAIARTPGMESCICPKNLQRVARGFRQEAGSTPCLAIRTQLRRFGTPRQGVGRVVDRDSVARSTSTSTVDKPRDSLIGGQVVGGVVATMFGLP